MDADTKSGDSASKEWENQMNAVIEIFDAPSYKRLAAHCKELRERLADSVDCEHSPPIIPACHHCVTKKLLSKRPQDYTSSEACDEYEVKE